MDVFPEQVVKHDKTAKNLFIKIISVVLLFLVPMACLLLARVIAYFAMVGFFIFLGGIYIVWWIFKSQKYEFEYAVSGDNLNVSKIIAMRRRKKVCSVPIKEIASMEIGDKNVKNRRFRKIYFAAKNERDFDANTYAVFKNPLYGTCLLVFNPNDRIITAMRPHMNQELIKQLYYTNRR